MDTKEILECGHAESPHSEFTRGFGRDQQGARSCYACCADKDREHMIADGKATMYLTYDEPIPGLKAWKVTNWPGSLVFKVGGAIKHGRHNWAVTRRDVWFTGPDGKPWHGVQYGDNTQIVHCRRTKS